MSSGSEDDAVATAPPARENTEAPIDEAAESAFLAEARERGEVVPKPSAVEPVEEADPKSLPKLEELVDRIPSDVREILEDLFRARFVSVKRIPKKALK